MTLREQRPGCAGKIAYRTPKTAHAEKLRLHPKVRPHRWKKWRPPEPVHVYRCQCCRLWHLGTDYL